MQVIRRRVLLGLLATPAWLRAQPTAPDEYLPPIGDLRGLAPLIVRHKAPLLVLFSTPGCPFCREVRRNYLLPRLAEQKRTAPDLLLREADITSSRMIVEPSGAHITEAALASRFNVRVVPVVALFDQSLQQIAEPLVGLDRSGFYEGYLSSAIETARKRLRQTS